MGMDVISIRFPRWMINAIDELVAKGIFVSRAELIRLGVRIVLRKYEKELNNRLSKADIISSRLRIIKELEPKEEETEE
ncbi:hypothetical protein DRP04_13955 [Archaeoglobales archaeon]|nr:MAG: hypothetical protein DRP04_13955 [Archaeoglobales archaeon]